MKGIDGSNKVYKSGKVKGRRIDRKEDVLKISTYLVDKHVPFFVWKKNNGRDMEF